MRCTKCKHYDDIKSKSCVLKHELDLENEGYHFGCNDFGIFRFYVGAYGESKVGIIDEYLRGTSVDKIAQFVMQWDKIKKVTAKNEVTRTIYDYMLDKQLIHKEVL